MEDCIFCRIARHEKASEDVFYEDERVFAMLDVDWAVKGHSLVVWKEHVLNMSDLAENDFRHFSDVCRRVERTLLELLSVDKSIVLKSGGIESHFHFHVYPVSNTMSWEEVKDMFEKKIGHEPEESEKGSLLKDLKELPI